MLLALLALAAGGCKAAEDEKHYGGPDTGPAYGDMFIDASIGDASTLLAAPGLRRRLLRHHRPGLQRPGEVRRRPQPGGRPGRVLGNLRDGLTITFKLRQGVNWHDGAPFTAQDVLFTYQVMVDPKTPTAYSGDYLQVKKAEALDDYTFRVTYPQPFAPALGSWAACPSCPSTCWRARTSPSPPWPAIPSAPVLINSRSGGPERQIALTYNPDYFEGRPYLNGYIYLVKPDLATMFLELKAGNIDRMGLTPLQYTRQTDYPKFNRMYQQIPLHPFSYIYLGYNLEDPKFADLRVRQALTYAINKKEIIDGVLLGLGEEAYGPYKPGTWYYNPDVPKFSYDPEKAKALLAAGRLAAQRRGHPGQRRPAL